MKLSYYIILSYTNLSFKIMPRRRAGRRRQRTRTVSDEAGQDAQPDTGAGTSTGWESVTFCKNNSALSNNTNREDAPKAPSSKSSGMLASTSQEQEATSVGKSSSSTTRSRVHDSQDGSAKMILNSFEEHIFNDDGDDLDDFGSAWSKAKSEGGKWGGRGFGGRSLKVTGNERDVSIDSVTLAYDGQVLLERTKLLLRRGIRYGLIGVNGCGKSTLMRRIARKAIPGFPLGLSVSYVDQELRQFGSQGTSTALDLLVAFMEQIGGTCDARVGNEDALLAEQKQLESLEELDEDAIQRLCEIAESLDLIEETRSGPITHSSSATEQAMSYLKGFGFSEDMANGIMISELSGGWKMRLALLLAVVSKPSILLLDEPSNHLDLDSVLWLSQALQKAQSNGHHHAKKTGNLLSSATMTIVVVSHDRAFLDRFVDEIISFENKQLTYHPGNFTAFDTARTERQANKERLLSNREKKLAAVEKNFVKNTQSKSLKRTTKGYDPKKEKQAASHRKKAMERAGSYRSDGKRFKLHSLQTMSMDSLRLPTTISSDDYDLIDPGTFVFKFPSVDPASLRLSDAKYFPVFSMESIDQVGYQSSTEFTAILRSVTLSVSLSSRIALCGKNGSGKTTLLRVLAGDLGPVVVKNGSAGAISVHKQLRRAITNQHHIDALQSSMELSPVKVMQEHWRKTQNTSMSAGAARQLLGGFGLSGDLALMQIKHLSGGQKARLAMACAVNHNPHVLLMDEPTNHLDGKSREALVSAINRFDGGVVVVSHDEHFLKEICTELWIVSEQHVRVVKGNFSEAFDTYVASQLNPNSGKKLKSRMKSMAPRGRFD